MFNKHYFVFFLLLFLITACESLIEGPEDELKNGGSNGIHPIFSSIQEKVLTPACALSGCHGGSQNPNLSAGQAYDNLVNKASIENPSVLRVKPGESTSSLLIKKLRGDGTSVMPPSGQLTQATIDSIIVWIDNGALNN
jgi:hypothetical protein